MSYAIIGFGKIGQALAKAFARNGIEVSVATTRDPENFASAAAAIGPRSFPRSWPKQSRRISFFGPSASSRTRCREGAVDMAG